MDATILFDMSYGVYVVGTRDGEKPVGCVANTAFQITAEPMTIGVSVSKENYTENCIRQCGYFAMSILSEETPQDVIGRFGFQSGRDIDKFADTKYISVGENIPVLDEAVCSWVLCRVIQEVEVMTHTIFIGEVVDTGKLSKLSPMTYDYYHKVKKGKTAKNAPTYIKEQPENIVPQPAYVCEICGYRFEGTPEEFEALPEDWQCPICGLDKSHFELEQPPVPEKHYVCEICGYIFEGSALEFENLPEDWKCPVCNMGKEYFSLK